MSNLLQEENTQKQVLTQFNLVHTKQSVMLVNCQILLSQYCIQTFSQTGVQASKLNINLITLVRVLLQGSFPPAKLQYKWCQV